MLLPDNIYKRVPQFWMLGGILFLFFGFSAGSDFALFPAYMFFGLVCIARSVWIYQARWQSYRRNEMRILRSTQIIDHSKLKKND